MRSILVSLARAGSLTLLLGAAPGFAEVNKVETVAPDVYFHEGDLGRRAHCNNGWIVFQDYVLVVDGNFPSGAKEVIPKIRAITDKPIRFVFDTHHHGDHAYGNQVWADNGAVVVAHEGVLQEMKRYETGRYGDKPGRWEDTSKTRDDVRASQLKAPSVLFRKDLVFDDGTHRVELLHLGVAHTHGDGWAWLPKEGILFSGDACVNGPYNYVGDGSVDAWIETLQAALKLKPKMICPGHGPAGGPEILEDQLNFFMTLRREVKALVDQGKSLEDVKAKAAIDALKRTIRSQERLERYLGGMFEAQVQKVHEELSGKTPANKSAALRPLEQLRQRTRELGNEVVLERVPRR